MPHLDYDKEHDRQRVANNKVCPSGGPSMPRVKFVCFECWRLENYPHAAGCSWLTRYQSKKTLPISPDRFTFHRPVRIATAKAIRDALREAGVVAVGEDKPW